MNTRKQDIPKKPNPEIDEGIRRWYKSCPCCLSKTYPDIKSTLDKERHQHDEQGS